jgi:hypothetical protein
MYKTSSGFSCRERVFWSSMIAFVYAFISSFLILRYRMPVNKIWHLAIENIRLMLFAFSISAMLLMMRYGSLLKTQRSASSFRFWSFRIGVFLFVCIAIIDGMVIILVGVPFEAFPCWLKLLSFGLSALMVIFALSSKERTVRLIPHIPVLLLPVVVVALMVIAASSRAQQVKDCARPYTAIYSEGGDGSLPGAAQ